MGQNQGSRESKTTWIRRGRSGCWSCKGRKKKCPGELPSCSSCVRRGTKCDYGFRLTWQDEAESAGIAFGRAGLKNRRGLLKKGAAHLESPPGFPNDHYLLPLARCSFGRHWLNTTLTDISKLCLPIGDAREDVGKGFIAPMPTHCETALRSLPRGLSTLPDLPEDESSYFLEYYIRIYSQRRVLTKKAANPYQNVILPLSFHSPGLMNMVIAFASHDMRNQFQGSDCHRYDTILLRHKLRSIQLVRAQLAFSQDAAASLPCTTIEDKFTRDALLLIITLLGILEIANNSTHEWVLHMKGALSIVRHCRKLYGEKAFSREVLEFVSTCFSLRGTFLATTQGYSSRGGEEFRGWLAETASASPPTTGIPERSRISSYTGISLELLDIISSITSMVRKRRHSSTSATHLEKGDSDKDNGGQSHSTTTPETQIKTATTPAAQYQSIHVRLRQLQQWSDEPDLMNLVHINAAAFKEAAWIYLRHALCGEPSESVAIQTQHLPRLLSLLDLVHRQSDHPVGSKPYPMWALFVAACVAQEDCRSNVICRFMDLREHRPFSNVPVTMAAVEAVWKKTDLERGVKWNYSNSSSPDSATIEDTGTRNAHLMSKEEGSERLVWEGAIHRLGWMMALT